MNQKSTDHRRKKDARNKRDDKSALLKNRRNAVNAFEFS